MKRFFLAFAAMLMAFSVSAAINSTSAVSEGTDTYVVAGVEELCGSPWTASDLNNQMTLGEDGLYTKVYTAVAVGEAYLFKVVKNGNDWIGDATGNNFTFNVTEVCDVTISFNPTTNEVSVTGTGVVIPTGLVIEQICAVGNGDENWLNGASWDPAAEANKMTEVSTGVYQISFTGVPAGNYELKFAANGSWSDNWGATVTITESVENHDAVYNSSDNIKISHAFAKADIVLTLDLTAFDYSTKAGAKFSVTITETPITESPADAKFAPYGKATLEEGEYIFVYGDNAMANGVASGRLTNGTYALTDGVILNPDASIVWTIAKVGDNYSIYNAAVAKYAASTGAKNKAQLLDANTDTKAQWTVVYSEGTYDFENVANAAANVNKTLRNNTTYGWACYATGTGGALSLYKKMGAEVAATAVTLDKETAEVEAYKSLQLTATLEPADATNVITWTSSDEAVATVSATGLVTALAPGTATIKATAGTVEASCALTVKEATVLTAAEAAAIGIAVSGNNVLAENGKYVVEAYVIGAPTTYDYDATIITVNLADERGAEAYTLQAYKATGDLTVADGDKVRIVGDLSKYNTTAQLAAGAVITLIEKAPVPLVFELNGGEQVIPVNNDSLYELFKEDYKAFKAPTQPENYATIAGTTGANGVAGYATNGIIGFLTTNDYGWKWLGDYIIQTTPAMAEQTSETYWRYEAQGFFSMLPEGSFWAQTGDYAEAGKTEVWLPYYKFGYAPTKEGHKFLGWFDNAACEGEALTECPVGGTLYAGWEELVSEIWFTEGTFISALESGASIQFHVEYAPASATLGEITWSLDSAGAVIATVSETGLLTAKSGLTQEALAENNQVVLTATTVDGISAQSYIYIVPAGPKSVSITAPESTTLGLGETLQLEATTDVAGEFYFNWETSDDQLATVTTDGLVKVVSAAGGNVWVYVTVDGYEGLKDSIELTLAAGYPNISAEPTSDNIQYGMGSAKIGEEAVFTFLLKGENLAKDVVLTYYPTMATFQDNVLITPDTLSAAALQGDGVALTITVTPGGFAGNRTYPFVYTYVNEDAELEFEFASFTVQVAAVPYENLAAIIADLNAGELYEWDLASVASDLVVTHVSEAGIIELGGASVKQAYIQDATAGVVLTQYGGVDVVRGEHYATLEDCYFSIQEMDYLAEIAEVPLGSPTKTEEAVADVITLADIANHQGRLVRLNGVTFAASEAPFAADDEYAITIGEDAAKVVLFAGSELIGEAVPATTVDLVGIVRSTVEGNIVISPRDKADIIATTPSALDNVTINGEVTKVLRNGQVIIIRDNTEYNVLGTKLQ